MEVSLSELLPFGAPSFWAGFRIPRV